MDSIDAGRHDTVPDALGTPIEARDAKGALTLGVSDVLHRPIRAWARDGAAGPVTLRQRIEYGDAGDPAQPPAEREAAQARNLLGRAVAHYDEAGLATVTDVDFKGNVLDSARRVIADAPILAVYERAAAEGWRVAPFVIDWEFPSGDLLDSAEYRTTSSFDALNRITRHLLPVDVDGRRHELVPSYNRGGGLEHVRLDGTVYVQRITYDAKGQRTLIAYGNGVLTRYAYDPRTFRLTRLRSERYTPEGSTYRPSGPALQDYGYGYDLAGNTLAIRDRAPDSGIPNTPSGTDALDRWFTYDPTYRLRTATGRECDLPPDGPPWQDAPRCIDLTRTRAYTESYIYDAMGGILRLAHHNAPGGFVRDFTVETATNRLARMTIGGTPFDYRFDATGNMTAETTSRHFDWNHADQLVAFATQTAGAEPSVHAHYLYDASGERVKKLIRRQGGSIEVTHYLGGIEHHRWSGASTGENNHVHVMDDSSRIALVRTGSAAPGDGGAAVQFHLGDHLGSSAVVVNESGVETNREEFTPYGETSFGSFARKRYRFTGKERDEESALNYHGARYLSSWTGRFTSVDPHQGRYPQCSPYCYASANPMRLIDPNGSDPEAAGVKLNTDAINALSAEAEHASANLARAQQAFDRLPSQSPPTGSLADLIRMLNPDFRRYLNASAALTSAQDTAEKVVGRVEGALRYLEADAAVQNVRARTTAGPIHRDATIHTEEAVSVRETELRARNASHSIRDQLPGRPQEIEPKPWRILKSSSSSGGGGGQGPTIVNEIDRPPTIGRSGWSGFTRFAALGGLQYFMFVQDVSQARSPEEILGRSADVATGYMAGEVGMVLAGPPGAVVGAVAPEVVKDPVGFTEKTVQCVFGGHCGKTLGDISEATWDWFRNPEAAIGVAIPPTGATTSRGFGYRPFE
jgi:RHS repeat-associated protein